MRNAVAIVGWGLTALSLVLVLGNITGLFTTLPFAGALVGMVASTVLATARGPEPKPASATETRGYSVITIAFVAALMVMAWLVLGELLALGDIPQRTLLIVLGVTAFLSGVFVWLIRRAMAARRARAS